MQDQDKPSKINIEAVHETAGNFFKLRQYCGQYRQYDGKMSETICRELFVPPYDATGMLLYDPKTEMVALTEQCRFAPFHRGDDPWILEMVMGMHDAADESPEQGAIREAREEAGATVQRVTKICEYYASPGVSTEYLHLFCGEVDITTLGGVHGLAEENEDIKVIILSLNEAAEFIQTGKIRAATTIIALQWLLLNKETLWR